MLTSDAKKALEDIVGPEWVCADPHMMDAYAVYHGSAAVSKEGTIWTPRAAAVVLPKTTREVSEITRFCNNHDYEVHPFSTGLSAYGAPGSEKTILLDLKRMNKIIDIDVKNQIAVIEPYVKAIILQTELWKHGLNLAAVSAGGQHSTLASVSSYCGYGLQGPAMSYNGRNLLGLEWVMPSGQVVRLGSGGSGARWFTDAGPGPSLRGLIRGFLGTCGGLGTFTKCAVKLYRWDGPAEMRCDGGSPRYELIDEMPSNMGIFSLSFPSKEAMGEAGYKLGEAQVPYADFRLPAFFTALYSTDTNLEFIPLWKSGIFQKIAKYSLLVFVSGHSQREYDWKMRALKEILKECGGLRLPLQDPPKTLLKALVPLFNMVDPMKFSKKLPFIQTMIDNLPAKKTERIKILSVLFLLLVRNANNAQGSFRPTGGGMFSTVGALDTWDCGIFQNELVVELKKKYIKEGLLVDDDADLGCGGTYEDGQLGYLEGVGLYNQRVRESAQAARATVFAANQASVDHAFGSGFMVFGSQRNALFGPHCSNYHLWMEQIKAALDPNSACDSWTYSDPPKDPSNY